MVDLSRDERVKSTRLYWVINDLRSVLTKLEMPSHNKRTILTLYCFTRYIVQNEPNEWSESLKTKFHRFIELFLQMFRRFQVSLLRTIREDSSCCSDVTTCRKKRKLN